MAGGGWRGWALVVLVVFGVIYGDAMSAGEFLWGAWARSRRELQTSRIAGHENSPDARFLYRCSIRRNSGQLACGAVLKDPNWALTVAHCVHKTMEHGKQPAIEGNRQTQGSSQATDSLKYLQEPSASVFSDHSHWEMHQVMTRSSNTSTISTNPPLNFTHLPFCGIHGHQCYPNYIFLPPSTRSSQNSTTAVRNAKLFSSEVFNYSHEGSIKLHMNVQGSTFVRAQSQVSGLFSGDYLSKNPAQNRSWGAPAEDQPSSTLSLGPGASQGLYSWNQWH